MKLGTLVRSRKLVKVVEALGMQAARAMTGHALESTLPGIGIVSDITLMWDGVSIGATSFSRYETLCVTGGNFVDYQTGALRPRLLAAPSLSLKHGGRGQVDLLRRELKSMHLGTAALRSRLVVLGADGAGTRGGEDARHQSTGAAEILWEAVFPGGDPQEMGTRWDLFHRLDIAVRRAISAIPAATEVFDIARVMGTLFGIGDGRAIFRGCGAALDLSLLRVPDQGGTRKCVALARCVANLLRNLPGYAAGMHARMAQTQRGESRGTQPVGRLLDSGRRLTSMSLVVFALSINDVLVRDITPVCKLSESGSAEAIEVWKAIQDTLSSLASTELHIDRLRRWLSVTVFVSQYVSMKEMRFLWAALSYTPEGKNFPCLTCSMSRLLLHQQ